MPVSDVVVLAAGMMAAGTVKGATGVAQALLSVPVLAAVTDLRTAVVVTVMAMLVTNASQLLVLSRQRALVGPEPGEELASVLPLLPLVLVGGVGTVLGSILFYRVDERVIAALLALVTALYVAMRLRPRPLTVPAGRVVMLTPAVALGAGMLQGSTGAGGPPLIAYLNALGLPRRPFIRTASAAFVGWNVVQLGVYSLGGSITRTAWLYLATSLPTTLAGLALGDRLGRRFSQGLFDRLILVILALVAVRFTFAALAG